MKNFTNLLLSSLTILLLSAGNILAQDTIWIDGGFDNAGLLETTINGDTIAGGGRANPNRVYMLKKDEIYYQSSRIQFGGDNVSDSTSTLIIVGESGGNKPIILMSPLGGEDAFVNIVHGSLTLKNLYLPIRTLNDKVNVFYRLFRSNQTLRVEDCVTEYGLGDMFQLNEVDGQANIFFKNTYFRDANWFGNGWNTALFVRGTNGEAIDTVWIENCTATNPGLTFFGKNNPIKFFYFNHNTIVNVAKYVFFFEQYEEAYFTNNIFINCNWEGECQSTYETQIQSQIDLNSGPAGVTNMMEIDEQLWQLGHGYVPEMEDVRWFSSNNIHYTSPFLDSYYAGDFNNVGDYPISSRTWSVDVDESDIPIPVENVPSTFISEYTQSLIDQYPGIIASRNFDNTLDPQMNTKGIASQEVGNEFAKWGRNNYGVAEPNETFDRTMIAFGDQDPTTVPGVETENGAGFEKVTDLIEDFAYQNSIRSNIDGLPIGSLLWWPNEFENYNSAEAFADVVDAYENPVWINELAAFPDEYKLKNYPSPFNQNTFISFTIPETSEVRLDIFDAYGRNVKILVDGPMSVGTHEIEWDATRFSSGIYYFTIAIDGHHATKKLILQRQR